MNYFELFGQDQIFLIDKEALKQALLALQKRHHPDVAGSNQAISSDLLNHAFDVLASDDKRAIYLLELQGVHINLDATTQDKVFLNKMMALRIDLEEAKQTSDKYALDELKLTIAHMQETTAQAFAHAFADKDWQSATALALNLRFLARLAEAAVFVHHDDQADDLYV